MASGLAARIEDIFGITPQLVDGHNGIYEVSINRETVVTNQGKCAGTPTEDEILSVMSKYTNPLPGKEKMVRTVIPLMKG
jgi:hypothetical protein